VDPRDGRDEPDDLDPEGPDDLDDLDDDEELDGRGSGEPVLDDRIEDLFDDRGQGGPVDVLRGPMPDRDDDEHSGLGAAFDEDEPDDELDAPAPPLDDQASDDLLTRYLQIDAALAARWPESKLEPSLDRVRAVADLLGDPQRAYPVIHVAGTNGKTSTARMIESLLRGFGLRTGLFTSPHLHSVRERIRLDGEPIDLERFVRVYDDIEPYLGIADRTSASSGGPAMSFFEVLTMLGYAAFADAPVDVAVVECGMGGAWDATNVADGAVAVVTPISYDHMDYLGDTLTAIAGEKAGIIKPESTAVLAAQELEAAEVLLARCVAVGVEPVREGVEFGVVSRTPAVGGQLLSLQGQGGRYDDVFLPLFGAHQAANAAVAVAAVEAFLGGGSAALNVDLVRSGFASVTSPGRLEVVRRSPTVIVDAAHNPHGASALAAAIADGFEFTALVGVIAVLSDKDARGVLEALEPVLAEVVITRSSSPRATDPDALAALAVEVLGADRVRVEARLGDALDAAIERADELAAEHGGGAGVLVTGSVVTAAEARALLGKADA
jgi:dihydrofolate synthase/folylpolyglutamate synthase